MSNPVNIFIAYSRSDAAFLDELRRHLMPLSRSERIKVWYDGEIDAGRVWEIEIKKALASAEIIILMVSSDSIASDYFYGNEVAAALSRHETGTARVVPLIIRACQWAETPLKNLQAVPKDGRPIANWQPRDDGWFDAAEAIGRLVSDIERERKAAANAIYEKEKREIEAKNASLAAQIETQRLEKKAAAEATKKQQADQVEKARREKQAIAEAERAIVTEKRAELARQKADAQAARKKELDREKEQAAPPDSGATSEWKINLGVGAILVVIFGIAAFLFFKTEACLSNLGKTDRPGVVLPQKTEPAAIDTSRINRGVRVIDATKVGVKPAAKSPKLTPLVREPAKKD